MERLCALLAAEMLLTAAAAARPAANLAKGAAGTDPVLFGLCALREFFLLEAEGVERLAAGRTVQKLFLACNN